MRYYGCYSNVSRKRRKKLETEETVPWRQELIEVAPPLVSKEFKRTVLAFSPLRYRPAGLLRTGGGSPRSHERVCLCVAARRQAWHPRCRILSDDQSAASAFIAGETCLRACLRVRASRSARLPGRGPAQANGQRPEVMLWVT